MQGQDNRPLGAESTLIDCSPQLVGNWVHEHEIATICSRPGIGKSPLLWDWAVCVATGRLWTGSELTDSKLVTYIDTQSNPHRIRAQMQAIVERRVSPDCGWPPTLIVNNERVSSIDEFRQKFLTIVPAYPVRHHLIIVDNALSYFSFINATAYNECAKWLDDLRRGMQGAVIPTTLILAHTTRQTPAYKPNDILRDIRHWISHTVGLGITAEPDCRLGIEFAPGSEDVIVLNGVARGRKIIPSFWQISSDAQERMVGWEMSNYVLDVRQMGFSQQHHQLMLRLPAQGFTTADAIEQARHVGMSRRACYDAITKFIATGLIVRVAHGVYRFQRMI